jgi:probable rRNA maturation factor
MSDDADKPNVIISDRQQVPADHDALADLARSTLTQEGAGPVELSVSLVNAEEMTQLHVQFAGEAGPTDVLSFTMDEDGLLGDVVICPEVAKSQATDSVA